MAEEATSNGEAASAAASVATAAPDSAPCAKQPQSQPQSQPQNGSADPSHAAVVQTQPPTVVAPVATPVTVRLRQKQAAAGRTAKAALAPKDTPRAGDTANGGAPSDAQAQPPSVNGNAADAIQRAMGSLYETSVDAEDNTEEIRKLDSQLDHLNEYMDKVEERLKSHSEKLMETIRQQKEEREKRRRSFHERLDANRQEDDDFQRQLTQILHRVDSLKRQSLHNFSALSLESPANAGAVAGPTGCAAGEPKSQDDSTPIN